MKHKLLVFGAGVALLLGVLLSLMGTGASPASARAETFASPLAINEIDYDQPGTNAAEFIEIVNTSGGIVNLNPYSLVLVNGNGGGAVPYATVDLPNVNLDAGGYYVVCANPATVANCDLDATPDTNLIQNGAPDAVALVLDATIIDTVSYEGDTGAPYTEGLGAAWWTMAPEIRDSPAARMGSTRTRTMPTLSARAPAPARPMSARPATW